MYVAHITVLREEVKEFQTEKTYWTGRVKGLDISVFQWIRLQASKLLKDIPQKKVQFKVCCSQDQINSSSCCLHFQLVRITDQLQ